LSKGVSEGGVSVVIPTIGRTARLTNLLESLNATAPTVVAKVVVVDDTPGAPPVHGPVAGRPVEVLHSEERRFISRAKNAGWRATSTGLVAFIDDDNCLTEGLLDRLAGHFDSRPRLGAVMPGVLYKRRPNLVWVYATPFRPNRWSFELMGRNLPRDPALENRWLPTDALPNFSVIRREALEAVGGFDEDLPVNSSADLCQRIKRAGWEVAADSGALTLHDVEPPGERAFWAAHATQDPVRVRHEVADWFEFQRLWNGQRRLFRLQASWHALNFLLPNTFGVWVRRGSPRIRLTTEMVRGYRDAMRRPVRPRGDTTAR
jgi:GT2 family glycosyltransferase